MQKSSYYMLLPGFQLCQWIGLRRLRENYRLYPHGYLETASWWRCSIRRRMVSTTSMICLGFLYVFPGWWSTYPSDIYEFVSWDDEIPNLWKVIIHSCSEPPTSIAICKTYKSLLASISYMATLFFYGPFSSMTYLLKNSAPASWSVAVSWRYFSAWKHGNISVSPAKHQDIFTRNHGFYHVLSTSNSSNMRFHGPRLDANNVVNPQTQKSSLRSRILWVVTIILGKFMAARVYHIT